MPSDQFSKTVTNLEKVGDVITMKCGPRTGLKMLVVDSSEREKLSYKDTNDAELGVKTKIMETLAKTYNAK